ncbi:EAL domain-containing protein [Pseudomonas sp. MAP12]|uniref:EAL domain-containing protein n=1 Tax=Geopseudomonas aromaticivorans TaxID=2849492 RepID=A0ABS6N2V3_9GAMM|nr:EAL domain-containing protein [Pseudomonas aromaticivorans]MBV2135004.1 EAL domain-containing protein [Pseudomonas aromaticivorans]
MPVTANGYRDARILVLDDNPNNVELLLDLLDEHGYGNVRGLCEPRQLAALLEQGLPDLLLLDIRMPHLSGLQVLDQLRTRWGEQAPPVIVLSAQTDLETRLEALARGARDFVGKPFDQQEVLQRIHNTLEVHFLLRERSDQALLLGHLVDERTAEIQRLSFQDPVTALPNRPALLASLAQAAARGQALTLCHLALDGLDEVARLHGTRSSETLARHLRERLRQQLGSEASIAVWSSHEWVIHQPLLDDAELARRCRLILDCAGAAFSFEHLLIRLGARLGVSHSHMPHDDADHLVRLAALAVPEERDQWRLYQASLEAELQQRTRCRQALHEALARDQLFLVYQPKIDLRNGRVLGAEALLRWVHPELGFVSPAEFIPMAEASGDILPIGDWVIDRAIHQLEAWRDTGEVAADFSLAVNVAPLQLMQDDFATRLLERLSASTLPLGALEIEVTETGLVQDVQLARHQLQRLAEHGLSIAIDDFGTGHSSLAYLKTLPVSVLKIDRTFVSQMDTDPQDQRLAETVIDMARNFGCITVAEGVEKPEQAEMLQAMGCELAQGYWYSPPLKVEQFVEFCAERQQLATA